MADKTAILLWLDEQDTSILPSDQTDGLEDLTGDATGIPAVTLPTVVDSFLGKGRQFATDKGLKGVEKTAGQTLITRDFTIEVLCKPDLASMADGDKGVLIQRGSSGSAAERVIWGLEIERYSATEFLLRAKWENSAGTAATVPSAPVQIGTAGYVYLWATRRWVSTTEALVRYGVNDVYLGEETVALADIGNGTSGTTFVGCRRSGVGTTYADFFKGIIDSIRVSNAERCPEELRQVYRLLAVHAPAGYATMRALVPARVYSPDPTSIVQRELQVEGSGLGYLLGGMEDFVEGGLPDRAWDQLDRWEGICRLPSPDHERAEKRRARILGFLRSGRDSSHTTIKAALAEALDAAAADLQILEYSNLYEDPFTGAAASYWFQTANSGGGSFSIVANAQRISGSGELRWEHHGQAYLRLAIDRHDPYETDAAAGAEMTVKITANAVADDMYGGIIFWSADRSRAIWVGLYGKAPDKFIGYSTFKDGVWAIATNLITNPVLPVWVTIRYTGSGSYTLYRSTVSADDRASATVVPTAGPPDPYWCAVVLFATVSAVAAGSVDFDDARAHFPKGIAPYHWYIYRDQLLAGNPDMDGANRIVRRIKQAHYQAAASQVTAALCDDPESLTDEAPLG